MRARLYSPLLARCCALACRGIPEPPSRSLHFTLSVASGSQGTQEPISEEDSLSGRDAAEPLDTVRPARQLLPGWTEWIIDSRWRYLAKANMTLYSRRLHEWYEKYTVHSRPPRITKQTTPRREEQREADALLAFITSSHTWQAGRYPWPVCWCLMSRRCTFGSLWEVAGGGCTILFNRGLYSIKAFIIWICEIMHILEYLISFPNLWCILPNEQRWCTKTS